MNPKTWITTVIKDPETTDILLEFPPDLLDAVGWKEGDTITWEMQDDGSCVLTKVEVTKE